MESEPLHTGWKAQLRYGKLKTTFQHYTVIAEGVVGKLAEGFSCEPGNAFMAMKTWAASSDESADMIRVIGEHIGFTVTGKVLIYETEPKEPPSERPRGYDIGFFPFNPMA